MRIASYRSVALISLAASVAASPALAQPAERPPATLAARAALADFARCVVTRSPSNAHDILTRDFTSPGYRNALRQIAKANERCHRVRSNMRSGGLPLAAAMAEALLARDRRPLNLRLLRAAGTNPATYAPSDRVAMCVARSDADNTAKLLTSGIASGAERAAASALRTAVARCTPAGVAVELDPYALRSILATASYRLIAAAGAVK